MRKAAAIALAAVCAASAARADTQIVAKAGAWEAFSGSAANGQGVCGVSTTWPDERYLGVKYYAGDRSYTLQLGSKDWTIKDGAKRRVTVQFDRRSPWRAVATGMHFGDQDGAGLQFEIAARQRDLFMRELRGAQTGAIQFPGGNWAAWQLNLDGVGQLGDTLDGCIRDLQTSGGKPPGQKPPP